MNRQYRCNIMAKEVRKPREKPAAPSSATWMTTFSDMVTLLLTFMVLIISITTLDPRTAMTLKEGLVDKEPSDYIRLNDGALLYSDWGMLAPVVELVDNLDQIPENVMFDQREIKNAIFQLDPAKTVDYEQLSQTAGDHMSVFRDNRGLVVHWDQSLLFAEGGAALLDDNIRLLQRLALFLKSISLPVSIESHTDPLSPLEGGTSLAAYELSMKRSKVVMEYLASLGLKEERFRIGAHGGSRPRTTDPELAWENSRLEIVIYRPEPNALFGH